MDGIDFEEGTTFIQEQRGPRPHLANMCQAKVMPTGSESNFYAVKVDELK
jgi:hypothetical protein